MRHCWTAVERIRYDIVAKQDVDYVRQPAYAFVSIAIAPCQHLGTDRIRLPAAEDFHALRTTLKSHGSCQNLPSTMLSGLGLTGCYHTRLCAGTARVCRANCDDKMLTAALGVSPWENTAHKGWREHLDAFCYPQLQLCDD